MARRFRLLTDEHFPSSLVDVLAPGTPDGEVFAYAAQSGFVWVSSDERAQKWPRSYMEQGRPFAGMLVWTQESRYRMRPGNFVRQLAALEVEPDPFGWGIRHIRPE